MFDTIFSYQVVFQLFKGSRFFEYCEPVPTEDQARAIAKRLKKKSPSILVFVRTILLSDGWLIPIISSYEVQK